MNDHQSVIAAVHAAAQDHARNDAPPAGNQPASAAAAASAPAQAAAAASTPSMPAQSPSQGISAEDRRAICAAERSRISAILSCEAAKGRDAFANHLAFRTDMSVDDATAFLSVAPVAAPAAAAAPETPKSPLAAAMAHASVPPAAPVAPPVSKPAAVAIDASAIYGARRVG